jgi:hypothetical protein
VLKRKSMLEISSFVCRRRLLASLNLIVGQRWIRFCRGFEKLDVVTPSQ